MSQIVSVTSWPVAYTQRGYFKFFPTGSNRPAGRRTVVVRIADDAGYEGWGQAVPSPRWSYETPESVRSALDHYLGPELIGVDVDDAGTIERRLNAAIAPSFSIGMPIAKAGIDLALWELRSRRHGVSVAQHIANEYPEFTPTDHPVTLSWTINVRTLDELNAQLANARERGYRHFNVKVAPDSSFDLELCRRVRAASPDGFLWADANGGYDLAAALEIVAALGRSGLRRS
ncbi:MAG: enolase C-terminal domain-like protein [Pirellulales bacterium]